MFLHFRFNQAFEFSAYFNFWDFEPVYRATNPTDWRPWLVRLWNEQTKRKKHTHSTQQPKGQKVKPLKPSQSCRITMLSPRGATHTRVMEVRAWQKRECREDGEYGAILPLWNNKNEWFNEESQLLPALFNWNHTTVSMPSRENQEKP